MGKTIFKLKVYVNTLAISPDGTKLAAVDCNDRFYFIDIKTGSVLYEKELDMDNESLDFDFNGQRLFLNDSIQLQVFSVPGLEFISLPAIEALEKGKTIWFLDSTPKGDVLVFDPNGYFYLIDPDGENYKCAARFEKIGVPGKYLGAVHEAKFLDYTSNAVTISAMTYPLFNITIELDQEKEQVLPPYSEWEKGLLVGMRQDGTHVLQFSNELHTYAIDKKLISKCTLPDYFIDENDGVLKEYRVSPDLDYLSIIDRKVMKIHLYDIKNGEQKDSLPFDYLPFIFHKAEEGLNIIYCDLENKIQSILLDQLI